MAFTVMTLDWFGKTNSQNKINIECAFEIAYQ